MRRPFDHFTFDGPLARGLLGSVKGDLALDIGARGDSAFFIARNFNRVSAYEPDEVAFNDLANRANTHREKRVMPFRIAVVSVDDLHARCQLIKIDIESGPEGSEKEMHLLHSASMTIEREHPAIYYEYESNVSRSDAVHFLRVLQGYDIIEVRGSDRPDHGWLFAEYPKIPSLTKLGHQIRSLLFSLKNRRYRLMGGPVPWRKGMERDKSPYTTGRVSSSPG